MAKYFQIDENGKIINVALGDESWVANAEKNWILDTDNKGEIGGYYLNNIIYLPAPSEGWTFNKYNFQWEPPQNYPDNYNSDIMSWNNSNTRWEKTDFILLEGQTVADDNTPFTSSYWDPNSTSWIQFFDSRN